MRIFYTRWLMLRRRAGSHSTGSTCYDIAWTSHNFYFAPLLRTLGILGLVPVRAERVWNWKPPENFVPDRQDIQTNLPQSPSFPSPKGSPWQGQPKQLLESGGWSKEKIVIPGIYQVYTRYIHGIYEMSARGQAAESGCSAGPEVFIADAALNPGLCLTSICISPIFPRDIPVLIFLILESLESVTRQAWRAWGANKAVLLRYPKGTQRRRHRKCHLT